MNRSLKKTIVLKVDPERPGREAILRGSRIIKEGGLVAFPTETVYGLGANAFDDKAIRGLCKVKNRPAGKPFTMHISDTGLIEEMLGCSMTKEARALADKFWPGPLTMILRSAKGEHIGFRIPRNKIALRLISACRVPLAAPSANQSGIRPPMTAGEVMKDLGGRIDMILDGGPAEIGIESTVIDMTVTPLKILREGAISCEKLEKFMS